jgi:luciferase family oxidoreductase group 1
LSLRLSVLDQSPIVSGGSSAEALRATVALAQRADQLGYHRYWLAEHHNMRGLADPCPEILVGHVAAATQHIRVGTGGVMLPYYSPLKVAEVFRMHEALHPQRIDLGIGRAPGADRMTANAMNAHAFDDMEGFPRQVMEVVGWLDRTLPEEHPYAAVQAMPSGLGSPEVWLLGSSDYSGALASYLGLRFAFAHFINAHGGDAVARAYRNDFRPSLRESVPYAMVCVFALCAESDAEAQRLAASIDHRRLLMSVGREAPIATVEEALAYPYTERDRAIIERERARAIIGTPEKVKARLLEIANAYAADELMIVTITGDYTSRMRSYELLAAEFDLTTATSPPALSP